MAGRLRLNTNVTQHEYDAVTPTQNKPAQMQYALLDAINLVPRTAERPQIEPGFYFNTPQQYQQQRQQQQYIPQPSSTAMFESLAAAAPAAPMAAPILGSVPYPLAIQHRHQFAGEHDSPAYTSYAASDVDSASSAGPGTPAMSDWSPATFTYPTAPNGFVYGNPVQQRPVDATMAFGHLYSSIYNPAYVNTNMPYPAFAQAPVVPVQHLLPQSDLQQQQQQHFPPTAPPALSNLAFAELSASLPAVSASIASSPDTNALYYSSGEESSHTTLSRASSIASIASSTGSRSGSLKYRNSNKSADGTSTGSERREKKFTCTYPGCDRSFSRNFNLSTHYNTHLGIKPFACTHCDKTFSRRHDCARHIAAVHTPAYTKSGTSKDDQSEHEHEHEQEQEHQAAPVPSSSAIPYVNPPSLAFAQLSPFMANHGVMPNVYDGM